MNLVSLATQRLGGVGETLVSFSLASIPNLFAVMVYSVLIPILVFFFLKDRTLILNWMSSFLPDERPFMHGIWIEMNSQVSNYARGKALEILIVGATNLYHVCHYGTKLCSPVGLVGRIIRYCSLYRCCCSDITGCNHCLFSNGALQIPLGIFC